MVVSSWANQPMKYVLASTSNTNPMPSITPGQITVATSNSTPTISFFMFLPLRMPVLFSQTGNCGVVFFSIERYGLRYTLAHHTLYQSPPNASHSHVRYFPIYVAETSNFIENTAN